MSLRTFPNGVTVDLSKDPLGDYDGDGVSNYDEMLARTDPWPKPVQRQLTPEEIARNQAVATENAVRAQAEAQNLAALLLKGRATTATAAQESEARPYTESVPSADGLLVTPEQEAAAEQLKMEARRNVSLDRQTAIQLHLPPEIEEMAAPPESDLHIREVRPGHMEVEMPFNVTGARSIKAVQLWPSSAGSSPIGTSPLPDVTGANQLLAIWEAGGGVMAGHSELGFSRVDLSNDNPALNNLPLYHSHATAVAGTMIAAGNTSSVRGVAYQGLLEGYDSVADYMEMADSAAEGLRFSNHSYGNIGGWIYSPVLFNVNGNLVQINWRWLGRASGSEDASMGLYTAGSRRLDLVCLENPYYLPVYAAGNQNQSSQQGPVGSDGLIANQQLYYRIQDDDLDGVFFYALYSTTAHPTYPGITVATHLPNPGNPQAGALTPSGTVGNPGYTAGITGTLPKVGLGFDTIKDAQVSKNALIVGAVEDLDNGVTDPTAVKSAIFSSRDPTDDGRIKPDVVADGTTFTTSDVPVPVTTNLPSNTPFDATTLTNNTSSSVITGWSQDATSNAAEIRREETGLANGPNHLVIKSAGHRVWQDFGGAVSLAANKVYSVRLFVGRKNFSAGVGSSPSNLTRVRLYAGASGGSFGTLVKTWEFNVTDEIAAPQGTQTIAWNLRELGFETNASPPSGTLRLVMENAGPGYSYFDYPHLQTYDSTGLTTANPISGTSFAAPTVKGGLALLQQLQSEQGGEALWASTWRSLLIAKAEDATKAPAILGLATSYPGPDFLYGWGVVNIEAAADLLERNLTTPSARSHILQAALFQGNTIEKVVYSDGTKPLKVVIGYSDPAWQDAYGTATAAAKGVPDPGAASPPAADPTTIRLVNDLDLEVVQPGGAIAYPYKLDPANPAAVATTGDNDVDNVEQVFIATPAAGFYTIRVKHEGSLHDSVRLLPGDSGYGTPDADNPLTLENEATLPRYQLVAGGIQPFSLITDGNTPTQADAFRIISYHHTATDHVIQWQSIKGLVYLLERSVDLQTWETRTAAGTWVDLTGLGSPPALFHATATAATTTVAVAPPTGAPRKTFYRVREAGMP